MARYKIESVEDWEPYLEEIRRLYVDEGRTLKSLLEYLETRYQVKAT